MKRNLFFRILLSASMLCSPDLFAVCDNVTAGGTVVGNQSNCGSFNPSVITNSVYPTGGTGTLQYQWQSSTNGTSWTDISGATLETYDPATISVTMYYKRTARRSGCTTYDGVSNTIIKTINALPTASITAGGPITFCSPGSVTLTANAVAGTTYQWKKNGANIAGATLQTYVASTSGNYTVGKTITATGCTATSNTIVVNVHTSLVTTITELGFNSCGSSTAILDVQSGNGYSYQWYEGTNALTGLNSNQLTTGHNGTYSCTITNSCGSYPSSAYPLNNFQLSILPYGVISASGNTTVCIGQSVLLYEGFQFFNAYQWYKDGVAIGGANSYNYSATAAGKYAVRITDLCQPWGTYYDFYSNWITITNSGGSIPTPAISAGGATTFCPGGNVVLTEVTGNGWSYQWRLNTSNISGATQSVYTATAGGSYTCAVTNSCGTVVSSAIAVVIQPVSVTISVTGQTNICGGATAPLTASTAGNGGTYQWKLGGSNISGATQATYGATAQGTYTCSITNQCGTYTSNSIAITVSGSCTTGLQFDGSNDYVKAPNNAAYAIGTGNFTVEAWINLSSTTTAVYPVILSHRLATNAFSGFMVYFSGGKLTIQLGGVNRPTYGPDLRDNLCHHIAITRSSTSAINFYIDGVFLGTNTSANYNITTTDNLIIGNDAADNFSDAFKGKLMEVRFWNLARTATQIQASKNTVLAGNETGLIGYWRLSDGSGQVANDFSTINNDAILGSASIVDTNDPIFAAACALCAPPAATITAGGATTFCSGGSVVLGANTGAGLTYQWKLGAATIVGATSSTYTANAAGSYTCIVTNSCGTATSNAIVVTVNTLPGATISATGSTTFCTGGSVVLNANTGAGLTYQWKKNAANISGATSSSYTATTAGSYTCTVTNTCGSSGSNTLTVTVNTFPAATITSSTTILCTGSSITLSANAGAGLTYQWKLNGTNISGATAVTYSATTAGSFTCAVTNSCGSTTSNTIIITSLAAPATPGTITGAAKPCPGQNSVPYSVVAVSGATTYTWVVPANATLATGQGTNSVTVNFSAAFSSGSITVTAGNQCGTSAARSKSLSKNIPSTPGTITGQSTSLCGGPTVSYSISAVSNATTYTWTVPAGATINSGQGSLSISVHYPTNFVSGSVTVTAGNSCGTSAARSLTVKSAPGTPVSITGSVTPCANQTLAYSTAAVSGATSYTWTAPSGATIQTGQGTNSVTIKFGSASGNVRVRANNSCGSSSYRTLGVTISCRESINPENIFDVKVYPNPSRASFTLKVTGSAYEEYDLIITDLTGRIVETHNNVDISNDFSCGNNLATGIYVAIVRTNGERKIIRLIKE